MTNPKNHIETPSDVRTSPGVSSGDFARALREDGLHEAADEIEKLRTTLEFIANAQNWYKVSHQELRTIAREALK